MPPNAEAEPSPNFLPQPHDAYAAMRLANFRRYWLGNVVSILGFNMQTMTVVWEVYQRTGDPLDVGFVGLAQVIPMLSLALLAGHIVDRFDRKRVLITALAMGGLTSLGLAAVSYLHLPIWMMFVLLVGRGATRSFLQPAKSSLVPQLVPRDIFSNAVAWNLSGFQMASIAGPAIGGWVLALFGHAYVVYLIQIATSMAFIVLLAGVQRVVVVAPQQLATLKSLVEGIAFVWQKKVVLGAMALDMFAVLLGGATALLPVFAKDILHVGPTGYGWMVSAPAIGALVMSIALVHRRPMAKAGRTLLWAVAGFGASIIVFGLSRSFPLSLFALFCTGAFDCISVVVRRTLVQMNTPDHMRGRVSSISGMFISASNELGEFESGTVAAVTSPVIAVVAGGIGTIAVVAGTAWAVPQLRRYGRLDGKDTHEVEPVAVEV